MAFAAGALGVHQSGDRQRRANVLETQLVGAEVALVDGEQRRDVAAGGAAGNGDALPVATVVPAVVPDPPERRGRVLDVGGVGVLGRQPVVRRRDEIAERREPWSQVDEAVLVSVVEPAAVEEDDDGMRAVAGRDVEVELAPTAGVSGARGVLEVADDADSVRGLLGEIPVVGAAPGLPAAAGAAAANRVQFLG